MAQTTYSVPMGCGYVAYSIDCVTYVDIGGYANTVVVPEQTHVVGEAYTFDGNSAIVKGGNRQPLAVTVSIMYTEDDAGPFDQLEPIHAAQDCGDEICVRWMPRGNVAGYQEYTITGPITGFQYPNMDAAQGGPIVCTFTVTGPTVVVTVKAS